MTSIYIPVVPEDYLDYQSDGTIVIRVKAIEPDYIKYRDWRLNSKLPIGEMPFARIVFSETAFDDNSKIEEAPCGGMCKTPLRSDEKVCWKCGWRRP